MHTDSITQELPTLDIVSENTLLVSFAKEANNQLPFIIANASHYIQHQHPQHIIDLVPAYTNLLLYIDHQRTSVLEMHTLLQTTLMQWHNNFSNSTALKAQVRKVEVPVFYDSEVGPDLQRIAENTELSIDEIIQLHQQTLYTIYTIGFAPGFAYMGNVDVRIAEPRLPTPRQKVAAGSVGIAGKQTGIYPLESPGGWNIIGRTPLKIIGVDADGNLLCPFNTGDCVQFVSINKQEFLAQGGVL